MRKTAICVTAFAVICLVCGWAQEGQSKPSGSAAGQEEKTAQEPQSLPPGPVGLQPDMIKATDGEKPAAAEKKEETGKGAKPTASAPAATDPAKIAAPPAASPGGKVPGTVEVDQKTYLIGPEDVLSVIVWGQNPLSGSHVVRPDGRISVPLAGELQAAGLTPQQLEAAIASRLKDANLILDPHVSVGLTAVHSKKYYINGEVYHPGAFDLVVPTTIMEALVSAGGFREFANKKHIYILRGNQQFRFNFNDALVGKHPEQNIYLEDRDIIVVK